MGRSAKGSADRFVVFDEVFYILGWYGVGWRRKLFGAPLVAECSAKRPPPANAARSAALPRGVARRRTRETLADINRDCHGH